MRKGWGANKITKFTEKTLPIFKTPWMTVHDFLQNRNSPQVHLHFDDLSGRQNPLFWRRVTQHRLPALTGLRRNEDEKSPHPHASLEPQNMGFCFYVFAKNMGFCVGFKTFGDFDVHQKMDPDLFCDGEMFTSNSNSKVGWFGSGIKLE